MRKLFWLSAALTLCACGGAGAPELSPEISPEVSSERIANVHDKTLTLDTHIDIPLNYITEIDPSGDTDLQVDLPKLEQGKLDAGFWIIYTPQGTLDDAGVETAQEIAGTRISAIDEFITDNEDRVALAKTSDDVRRITDGGRHAILIGMENAYPVGDEIDTMAYYAEGGVSYVGLTHFGHNQFGDSSNPNAERDDGPRHNGLSELGRELIAELNDQGIMVDVSHAAKSTMMQAADLSRSPIIASHSGAKAIGDNPRNLDDEQLRKIAQVGGVAQMVALGVYVKPLNPAQIKLRDEVRKEMGLEDAKMRSDMDAATEIEYERRLEEMWEIEPAATLADFVDHIDHAVKTAGIDHVGIASDFDGGGGVTGWEDAAQTENVTAELLRRGYSETDIEKIWSENLLRVLDAAQAAAK